MKTQITLIFFLMLSISLYAQTDFVSAYAMGSSSDDIGRIIKVNSAGDVFLVGSFTGTVDFDPGPGVYNLSSIAGGYDNYLQKTDSSGNFLWAIAGNYQITDISIDIQDNVYLTGAIYTTSDMDPGAGTFILTPFGGNDAFVLKLDSTGNFLWAAQFGGPNTTNGLGDYGKALEVDNAGNVHIIGWFFGTVDFDPGPGVFNLSSSGFKSTFILKLDTNGNLIWAKNLEGAGDNKPKALKLTQSGSIVLFGSTSIWGMMDFDPGPGIVNIPNPELLAGFIEQLDSAGNYEWAVYSAGNDTLGIGVSSMALDSMGNIYVTGGFEGTVDFDPGIDSLIMTADSANGFDFIQKSDSLGNFIWAKQLTLGPRNIEIGPQNDIFTMGLFWGTQDADPGAGIKLVSALGAETDVFVESFNTSGDFLWVQTLHGPNFDNGNDLAIDAWSNLYLTGGFRDTIDVDPNAGIVNLSSAGSNDVFVVKMSIIPCGNFGVKIDSIVDETCLDLGYLSVTPLGGTAPFTYQWNTSAIDSFILLDSAGIYSVTVADSNNCQSSKSIWMKSPASATGFDLQASAISDGFQPGFTNNIWIDAFNSGCVPATGQLSVVLNPLISYNSASPSPDFINGDTLFWDFANWTFDSSHFQPHISATTSTSANLGDLVCLELKITPINGDEDSTNNVSTSCSTVSGAYDPNDKSVSPAGECEPAYVLLDQTLTYTIRFQNTGTAAAVNVFVLDSLDEDLDLSSFQVLTQSHDPMITEILPGNVIKFRFDNIYLPDSNANEPESHGFIVFEATPLSGLPSGTKVENSVGIFFDFNDPVYTNTVSNTLIDVLPQSQITTLIDTSCGDYTFNGQLYDESGIYTQALVSSAGCDSTISLDLKIDSLDASITLNDMTLQASEGNDSYQWINCDQGNIIIGETNATFTPTTNGNYAVIVSNGTCIETSDCIEVMGISTGINSKTLAGGLQYFPNPTGGILYLRSEKPYKNITVKVNNLIGQTINRFETSNTDRMEFELPEESGMYLIDVEVDEVHVVLKVFKE